MVAGQGKAGKSGERGPKGDHGQQGEVGVQGVQGQRGISFSKTQVLVGFLFVVLAFAYIANRSVGNADRIERLERQVECLQTPSNCEVNLRP